MIKESLVELRLHAGPFTLGALKVGHLFGLRSNVYKHEKTWGFWRNNALTELEERLEAWRQHAHSVVVAYPEERLTIYEEFLQKELDEFMRLANLHQSMEIAQTDINTITLLRNNIMPSLLSARKIKKSQRQQN